MQLPAPPYRRQEEIHYRASLVLATHGGSVFSSCKCSDHSVIGLDPQANFLLKATHRRDVKAIFSFGDPSTIITDDIFGVEHVSTLKTTGVS